MLRECEGKCCGRGRVVRVREISGAEMSNYQRIGDLISLISLAKQGATFLYCILYLISTLRSKVKLFSPAQQKPPTSCEDPIHGTAARRLWTRRRFISEQP
jgi:hypothetical protein